MDLVERLFGDSLGQFLAAVEEVVLEHLQNVLDPVLFDLLRYHVRWLLGLLVPRHALAWQQQVFLRTFV